MITKITIANEADTFSESVFTYVKINGMPLKGSLFYLTERHRKELLRKICASHKEAYCYRNVFYGMIDKFGDVNKMRFAEFEKIPLNKLLNNSDLCDHIHIIETAFEWDGSEYRGSIELSPE